MSTTIKNYIDNHPGLEAAGPVTEKLHIATDEGAFGRHSASLLAAMEGKAYYNGWGGSMPFTVGQFLSTQDNSGTVGYAASINGVQFITNATPTDNDDNALTTQAGVTVRSSATGDPQWFKASCRVQLASVLNQGFAFGFVTQGSTEIFTADPADGVFITKAKTSAQFVLRVVQNSTVLNTNITLAAVDATDFKISLEFKCGSVADGSDSSGGVFINGTYTPMLTTQLVALYNMLLTTPPVLSGHISTRVNSTTQRKTTMNYVLFEADR